MARGPCRACGGGIPPPYARSTDAEYLNDRGERGHRDALVEGGVEGGAVGGRVVCHVEGQVGGEGVARGPGGLSHAAGQGVCDSHALIMELEACVHPDRLGSVSRKGYVVVDLHQVGVAGGETLRHGRDRMDLPSTEIDRPDREPGRRPREGPAAFTDEAQVNARQGLRGVQSTHKAHAPASTRNSKYKNVVLSRASQRLLTATCPSAVQVSATAREPFGIIFRTAALA